MGIFDRFKKDSNNSGGCYKYENEFKNNFMKMADTNVDNFEEDFNNLKNTLNSWESSCPNDSLLDMAKLMLKFFNEQMYGDVSVTENDLAKALAKYNRGPENYDKEIGEWFAMRMITIMEAKGIIRIEHPD